VDRRKGTDTTLSPSSLFFGRAFSPFPFFFSPSPGQGEEISLFRLGGVCLLEENERRRIMGGGLLLPSPIPPLLRSPPDPLLSISLSPRG